MDVGAGGWGARVDVPREIWREGAGAPDARDRLYGVESPPSGPVAPFNAAGRALEGPTTRTRVPRPSSPLPGVHFYPSSEPRIRKISRTRAEGFWASESRVFHVHIGSASPEQLAPMSWSMVADGDAHCEIRWEIAHCLFASADNISELRISDIHSWRDTVFEVVAYVIDPFYYTGRKVLHRYVAIGKIESETALDVIRQASLIIGQSTELAEAIVDAIWLHDVPNWFHLGLRFFPRLGTNQRS